MNESDLNSSTQLLLCPCSIVNTSTSTMSSNSAAEMYHILMAHVLNDSIDVSAIAEHHVVELKLGQFLEKINQLAREYRKTFQYPNENSDVDGDFVKKLVQFSEFSRFVTFDEDKLMIELTPQKFQTVLTGILVDSSIRYSKILAREVDDLTEKYVELKPPVPTIAISLVGASSTNNEKNSPEVTNNTSTAQEKKEVKEEPVGEDETEEVKGIETVEGAEEGEVTPDDQNVLEVEDITAEKAQEAAAEAQDEADEDINEEDQETNELEREEDSEHIKEEVDEKVENGEEMEIKSEKIEEPARDIESMETEVPFQEDMEMNDAEGSTDVKHEIDDDGGNGEDADDDKATEARKDQDEVMSDDHLKAEDTVAGSVEDVLSEQRPPKRSLSPLVTSQKHKRFQNIAINLVKTIEEHRFLSPFLLPVVADQYEEVVFHPKDLKSILKSIKQKDEPAAYETVKDLERDIMLMFANCVMYNKSNAHLVDMAKQMKDDVRNTFKMFEDAESEIS